MIDVPPPVLDQLPTPCLVVDSAAASRNVQRCAAFFSGQRAALRPAGGARTRGVTWVT